MYILVGNRRSGKTSELIRLSHDKWQYIVCKDGQRVDNIVRLADKMNLDIPYPITIRELPLRSKYIKSVLVDDLEDVLKTAI